MTIFTVPTLISSLRKRKSSLGRSLITNITFLLPHFTDYDQFRTSGMVSILDKNIIFCLGKPFYAENELLPTALMVWLTGTGNRSLGRRSL